MTAKFRSYAQRSEPLSNEIYLPRHTCCDMGREVSQFHSKDPELSRLLWHTGGWKVSVVARSGPHGSVFSLLLQHTRGYRVCGPTLTFTDQVLTVLYSVSSYNTQGGTGPVVLPWPSVISSSRFCTQSPLTTHKGVQGLWSYLDLHRSMIMFLINYQF
jgi:hypothetical protein